MPRYRTVDPNPDPYAEARALFEAAKRANDRDSADRLSRMALAIAIAVEREAPAEEQEPMTGFTKKDWWRIWMIMNTAIMDRAAWDDQPLLDRVRAIWDTDEGQVDE